MKRLITYSEIENLCDAMMSDFMKSKNCLDSYCVDIKSFVTDYLGLPIFYESFAEPDPGRIGFLSDGVRPIYLNRDKKQVEVYFKAGTVVIEKYLQNPKELGRMRFTIAHEAAHYILSKHIPAQTDAAFHSEFDGDATYTPEMLKEMMSINEAFANRTAACLLMPRFLMERVLQQYNDGNKIVAYDGYVMQQKQKLQIQKMADVIGVNYSPFVNRLRELDMFELHPIEEYLHSAFRSGDEIQ